MLQCSQFSENWLARYLICKRVWKAKYITIIITLDIGYPTSGTNNIKEEYFETGRKIQTLSLKSAFLVLIKKDCIGRISLQQFVYDKRRTSYGKVIRTFMQKWNFVNIIIKTPSGNHCDIHCGFRNILIRDLGFCKNASSFLICKEKTVM